MRYEDTSPRCVATSTLRRSLSRMEKLTRFEMRLPEYRIRELEDLARETGQSAGALARLGILWVLKRRALLVNGEERAA